MAQLVFLGHFRVVAAFSHRGSRVRSFVRLPQAVALSTELRSVLPHRDGLRLGGFHRRRGGLLAGFGRYWRRLGETQFAASIARRGIAVRGLQCDVGALAWIMAGTL